MTAPELSYTTFFASVLQAAPAFRSMYEESVKDNDGELPHVLMGDLTRFVLREVEASQGVPNSILPVLWLLEAGINSPDPKVVELVAASFVENLQGEPALRLLRASLGAGLSAQLKECER